MLALVGMALFCTNPQVHLSHFSQNLPTSPHEGFALFAAMVAALAGAFWAYDGWNNVSFVAGGVEKAQINVPRGLLFGTLIVMVLYVAINLAYIYVLPLSSMVNSKIVATTMAREAVGPWGEKFVLIAILLSALGACNGSTLSSSRIYFAMARENRFFKFAGHVHPKF